MRLAIFEPQDTELTRKELVEFLKQGEKAGLVEITRNDDINGRFGVRGAVLEAKIKKGLRGVHFRLHYGGFMLESKKLSLSHDILDFGASTVFLNQFKLKGLDNIGLYID